MQGRPDRHRDACWSDGDALVGIDEEPLPVERHRLDDDAPARCRPRASPDRAGCEPIQATPRRAGWSVSAGIDHTTSSRPPGILPVGPVERAMVDAAGECQRAKAKIASDGRHHDRKHDQRWKSIRIILSAAATGPCGSRMVHRQFWIPICLFERKPSAIQPRLQCSAGSGGFLRGLLEFRDVRLTRATLEALHMRKRYRRAAMPRSIWNFYRRVRAARCRTQPYCRGIRSVM